MFNTIAIVGVGLIGSSIAHNIRRRGLAQQILAIEPLAEVRAEVLALGLADEAYGDVAQAGKADLIILATAVGTMSALAAALGPHLKPGAIVTDVGSVKAQVIADVAPHIPAHGHFIPGHPIAGTEKSGPSAGFRELFENRWVILTPDEGADQIARQRVQALWEACGAKVTIMDATAHDMVLAITSHLPHLIAFTIVDTAVQLEDSLKADVIKYSASGFRDFTRIAGSDPTMWRDIFLANKSAVLDILARFQEDLGQLERAIRGSDGALLFDKFSATRTIRREVVEQGQAGIFDPREPDPELSPGPQSLNLYGA